jgi:hypothetical protein
MRSFLALPFLGERGVRKTLKSEAELMLVSHTKKFIFLKTMKTAGTSIEIFLEPYCVSDYAGAEHASPERVSEAGIVGVRALDVSGSRFFNHAPAEYIRDQIGQAVWDEYLKVTCIRNPFDKAVSAFWMFGSSLPRDAEISDIRAAFKAYVFGEGPPVDRQVFTIAGLPCADIYIRYEHLVGDLQRTCATLGIPFEADKLGRYKGHIRPRTPALDAYYDRETMDRVAEIYAPEFEWFGYDRTSLEGAAPAVGIDTPALAADASGRGKPFVVFCAGLNRSGSTWQFNVVRELVRTQRSAEELYSCWIGDYDPTNPARNHVVKIHRPSDALGVVPDVTVTSFRDLRAVAGSFTRMKWCSGEVGQVDQVLDTYLADLGEWERTADVVVPYDRILNDPNGVVLAVASAMGMQVSADQAQQVVDTVATLKPGSPVPAGVLTQLDPLTQLHDGHIGDVSDDAARQRLEPHLIRHLDARYGAWLVRHGFKVDADALAERITELEAEAFSNATPDSIPLLPFDQPVSCSMGQAPEGLLDGFDVEGWGAWSVRPLSYLRFRAPASNIDCELVVVAGALTPAGAPPLVADVYLNGERVDSWYWRGTMDAATFRLPLPKGGGVNTVNFLIERQRSAQSLGIGPDKRHLGIALHSITVRQRG